MHSVFKLVASSEQWIAAAEELVRLAEDRLAQAEGRMIGLEVETQALWRSISTDLRDLVRGDGEIASQRRICLN